MHHRLAFLPLAIVLLSGCATATMVPFKVESTPQGAQVDVNGVNTGTTPTEIQLQCSKRWVGVAVAPGGWAYDNAIYEVTAYPSRQSPGVSQTKRVNACQVQNPPGHLYFDLTLDPTTPRQRIDLNINQKPNAPSLEDTLRTLKHLRDQGLLTEQEYREKVDKALQESGR